METQKMHSTPCEYSSGPQEWAIPIWMPNPDKQSLLPLHNQGSGEAELTIGGDSCS